MIATLIVAAGASTRMGSPKQLLKWGDSTLIRTIAERALRLDRGPVAVVLGAVVDPIRRALDGLPIDPIFNPEWSRGMGTSVRAGVKGLQGQYPNLSGIFIMLCDQPRIPHERYERLLSTFEASRERIVAASYGESSGVPAIFPKWAFDEMSQLPDEAGAKKIIARHAPSAVVAIDIPEASWDIDTPEDYSASLS